MVIAQELPQDIPLTDALAEELQIPDVRKLHTTGNYIKSLSLTAKDENGSLLGFAMFSEVETAGTKQLFLAGLGVAPAHQKQGIGTTLLNRGQELAKEHGYDWILAIDASEYLLKKHCYEYAPAMGFLPLLPLEEPKDYKALRLHGDAPAPCGTVNFPQELGLYCEQVWFQYRTMLSEDEYRKVIYTTRDRRRWLERAVLLLYFVTCLLLAHYLNKTSPLFVAGICVAAFVRTIVRPIQHTKKNMEMLRKKFGNCEWDEHIFFTDSGVMSYEDRYQGGHLRYYDNYRELYLKPDYLFLMTEQASGEFIMYRDIPDKDALVAFLKEKCPELRIKK